MQLPEDVPRAFMGSCSNSGLRWLSQPSPSTWPRTATHPVRARMHWPADFTTDMSESEFSAHTGGDAGVPKPQQPRLDFIIASPAG
jgi:hypothetical protein